MNKGVGTLLHIGRNATFFPLFLRRSHRAPADGKEKCDYRVPKVRSITHYTPFCQELWLAGRRETELCETAISCLKSCPGICLRSSDKTKTRSQKKDEILYILIKILCEYFHPVLPCRVLYSKTLSNKILYLKGHYDEGW